MLPKYAKLVMLTAFGMWVVAQPLTAEAKRKTGTVEIISATVDAKIFVDSEYVGDLPLDEPLVLPTGEHTFKITKRGYTDYMEVIVIQEGENDPLFVELFAVAGILIIDTEQPGAIVSVEGDVMGKTPFEGEIQPGRHSIMVTRKGHKDYVQMLDIEAGEEYFLDIKLERLEDGGVGEIRDTDETPWYKSWWFWTATGVVLAGVTTFAILALTEEEPGPATDFTFGLR